MSKSKKTNVAPQEEVVQNDNQPKRLVWQPDAEIVISGKEFEALMKLTELYEIPPYQLSHSYISQLYQLALSSGRDILIRMKEQHIATEE